MDDYNLSSGCHGNLSGINESLQTLMSNIRGQYHRYTQEEEAKLWHQMRRGNASARDKLFYSCAPWALKLAEKMSKTCRTPNGTRDNAFLEDMLQEGLIGIVEALKGFNPSKGRLSTYSAYYIRRRCWDFAYANRLISVSKQTLEKYAKANLVDTIPETELHDLQPELTQATLRLFKWDKQETYYDELNQQEVLAVIQQCIDLLPKRPRRIVQQRLVNRLTLRDIGKELNVTKERVRQIYEQAMDALRCMVRNRIRCCLNKENAYEYCRKTRD